MPVFSGWDVVRNYEVLYPGKLQKTGKSPAFPPETTLAKVAQPVRIPQSEEAGRKKIIDNRENSTYSVLENRKPALTDEEQAVLAQLTCEPVEPSEMIAKLEMTTGKVMSVLTTLTIKGLAAKHSGGRFSLK